MVRVRLKRTGSRNASCFRIVVMDQRSSRDGKAIEELGYYNPRRKEESIDLDRAAYWRGVGAVISETVEAIIARVAAGRSLKDIVKSTSPSKRAVAKAEAEAAAKAEAEAAAKAAEEAAKAEAEAAAKAAEEAAKAVPAEEPQA